MSLFVKLIVAGVCSIFLFAGEQSTVSQNQPVIRPAAPRAKTDESFKIPDDEKPFWQSAQAFLDAYAKRDAEAIGALFTKDAEFYDEFGERTAGRLNIVSLFRNVFDTFPNASIEEIQIERVHFVTETVAMEEGITIASDESEGARFRSRYVALHTKGADGQWLINTLKDFPREEGDRHEQLGQLSWFLGEWVNQDSEAVVNTECAWSDDGNYLLRRFTVRTYAGREMSGVQRTGWDPLQKKLRTWTFDSEGGFFSGLWTRNGDQWLLSTEGTTAAGEPVTGTAVYTVIDADMVTWQYRQLIVGNEVRDEGKPVTMVRRPPAPGGAGK